MKRRRVVSVPPFLLARVALLVGLGLSFSSIVVFAYATDLLRALEGETVDARFSVRGMREPPRELVLVGIDQESLDRLGPWPFRRHHHARAIDRISRDDPKVIVYDVQFDQGSNRARDDVALADAIFNSDRRIVLAATQGNERGQRTFLGARAEIVREDLGGRLGNGELPEDPDGVLRRVRYSVDGIESLAVAATEVADRRQVAPREFDDDGTWIDFYGPAGTVPAVPFARVAQEEIEDGFFTDKVVVVGATAPSLLDLHPTSSSGDELMPGAEIQANAVATVRRGNPLRSVPAVDVTLILALGLLAPVASLRLAAKPLIGLIVGVAAAFVVAAQVAFEAGLLVAVAYPLGALVISSLAVIPARSVISAFDRARDLFSRFVPAQMVEEVLGSRGDPAPGGVNVEGTVMFSDVRGFTRFAESLSPERVMAVLNRYLGEMTEAILAHGGTVVSYTGDGIMAVFGAPVERDDHADRAVAAAREMVQQRLPRFNEWLCSESPGQAFQIGIGVGSGALISGFVGMARRLEYTALGDTTNTAARLEVMTKGTPYQVFIAESTRAMLVADAPDLVYVDELEVPGRDARVRVWSLRDERLAEQLSPGVSRPAAR